MNATKLRIAMLMASLGLGILYILSRYMAPLRDLHALAASVGACGTWILYRGTHMPLRHQSFQSWHAYKGTPMERQPCIQTNMRAAFGWAIMDASWLGLTITSLLPWGVPGVLAILFQGFFLAGFPALKKARPDLYDSEEKRQSMDMMEHLMYVQADAAILALAWIQSHV